ncbi:hypothetical protein NL449_28335, partial [Klebsiella pneumoniae]|nr:hypothetical protein [Klebsiella pneumoniae]
KTNTELSKAQRNLKSRSASLTRKDDTLKDIENKYKEAESRVVTLEEELADERAEVARLQTAHDALLANNIQVNIDLASLKITED